MSISGMVRDVHSLMLSIRHYICRPALHLPTTASSTLQGALKDGFGEAVLACDMPESCKFQSLDGCQKRSLGTHKKVDLGLHPVVGLVLQVGIRRSFLRHSVSKALILFFRVSEQGPCFTAIEEDGGNKRLV